MEMVQIRSSVEKSKLQVVYVPWFDEVRLHALEFSGGAEKAVRASAVMRKTDYIGFIEYLRFMMARSTIQNHSPKCQETGTTARSFTVMADAVRTDADFDMRLCTFKFLMGTTEIMFRFTTADVITLIHVSKHTLHVLDSGIMANTGGILSLPLRGISHENRETMLKPLVGKTTPVNLAVDVVEGVGCAVRVLLDRQTCGFVPAYMVPELYSKVRLVRDGGCRAWLHVYSVKPAPGHPSLAATTWIVFTGYYSEDETTQSASGGFAVDAASITRPAPSAPATSSVSSPEVSVSLPTQSADLSPGDMFDIEMENDFQSTAEHMEIPGDDEAPPPSTDGNEVSAPIREPAPGFVGVYDIFGSSFSLDDGTHAGVLEMVKAFASMSKEKRAETLRKNIVVLKKFYTEDKEEAIRTAIVRFLNGKHIDKCTDEEINGLYERILCSMIQARE